MEGRGLYSTTDLSTAKIREVGTKPYVESISIGSEDSSRAKSEGVRRYRKVSV